MPDTVERPRLRPGVAAAPDHGDPRYVYLWDRLRLAHQPQRLTLPEFMWVQMFDGARSLRDIQAEAMRRLDGEFLPLDWFTGLVERLDAAMLLDGPRFRNYLDAPVREPSCLGCYESEPAALRKQIRGYFTGAGGPGLPRGRTPDGRLRACLVPHIDYQRGGTSYAWGFREVVEHSDASVFVIVGTSHYSAQRFTLTRKDFKTPLGIVPTDQAYIDRLVQHYGDGLFDDRLAHLPEHSIELEVVFLQTCFLERRPFRIVPLLVGPFEDCIADGTLPGRRADICRMVEALRRAEAEAEAGEPVCYLISGDLAHLGPKFGDNDPLAATILDASRAQDKLLLAHAGTGDAAGYFRVIADEADRRRICGLPPTYTVLEAVRPGRGKVLHYDQYIHPRGHESVSFASLALYR
jgi:AmmeMemoRadiSam system protein B